MPYHGTLIGQEPLIVHTRPAIDMDDEQFFHFCRLNGDLQIERTAEGDIIIMAPDLSGFALDVPQIWAVMERKR